MQIDRTINIFYTQTAVYRFCFALMIAVSTVYRINEVGLNPLQLVLVGTTLEVAYFLAEIPTGIVADVYSRKWSQIIGYTLVGVGLIVEGILPSFTFVLLSQVIWGVGATFLSGASQAWLAGEVGDEKLTQLFLRASQIGRISSILGILCGMALGSFNLSLGFYFAGGGIVLLAFYLAINMPETQFAPIPQAERNTWQQLGHTFTMGLSHVRASQTLMLIFAITIFLGLSDEGLDRLGEAHLIESFALPTILTLTPVAWLGIINIVTRLGGVVVDEIMRRHIGDDERDLRLVGYLCVLSTIYWLTIMVFALSINFGMAALVTISIALTRGASFNIASAWVTKQIDQKVRATVLSMFGQTNAFGQVIGGPIVGIIANAFGYPVGFVGVATLLLPVPILYRVLFNRFKSIAPNTN